MADMMKGGGKIKNHDTMAGKAKVMNEGKNETKVAVTGLNSLKKCTYPTPGVGGKGY